MTKLLLLILKFVGFTLWLLGLLGLVLGIIGLTGVVMGNNKPCEFLTLGLASVIAGVYVTMAKMQSARPRFC
jgi:hypothetical protein